jgi:hypothetical protein
MSQQFTRLVEKQLKELAIELGYKKKGNIFYKPVSEDVSFCLSFGSSTRGMKGVRFISAHVGIMHYRINKLNQHLAGDSYPFTVSFEVGYAMPEYNWWYEFEFVEGKDNTSALADIKDKVCTYGHSFFNNLITLDGLQDYYEFHCRMDTGFKKYHLPIIYYMKGDKLRGLKYIEEEIAENRKLGLEDRVTVREEFTETSSTTTVQVYRYNKAYEEFAERYRQLPEQYKPHDWE